MGTASARPRRLTNLADTVAAIVAGVNRRAGWMTDDWQAYRASNEADWRFDCGDLPAALTAWASTLGAIGTWTGQVGAAFLAADGDDPGGRHRLDEERLHALLPCDARLVIDRSRAEGYVDWGRPDDPAPWLEALDFSAMAVGHVGEGLDAVEVAYVVGTGAGARWRPATPAVLGTFATAPAAARFATALGVGSAGLSGIAAGLDQRQDDAGSLNFTDGEVAARAIAAGTVTGTAALAGGVLGGALAGAACGPAAPVCASAFVIAGGVAGSAGSNALLDLLVPGPGPAEHDPDLVEDEVASVAPGTILPDIPDWTWDVIQPIDDAGEEAGAEAFEQRHPYLDPLTLARDPGLVDRYDLPPPWGDVQRLAEQLLSLDRR